MMSLFLWINCHKNHVTTHVITFGNIYVMSLTLTVLAMHLHIEVLFILKAIKKKNILKGHMINKVLHQWSFHMKFMKVTKGASI